MIGIESAVSGTTTRDVVAKVSAKGRAYVQLNLKIGDGDEAQFVNVLAFDADIIEAAKAGKIAKGVMIYAEGRLQIGQWTGNDGRSRLELKMMAHYTRLPEIGRNKPKKAKPAKAGASTTDTEKLESFYNDSIPF